MAELIRSASFLCAGCLCLGLSGCISIGSNSAATTTSTTTTTTPTTTSNVGNFKTTVFLGDSLTAGYQNGSLLDTQQPNGWAALVAKQAGFSIALPLIAPPGAPAVLQLVHYGPPPVITSAAGVTTGRDNTTLQPTDLAVPGAFLNDVANTAVTTNPITDQQGLTDLVIGFPGLLLGEDYTQAQFAAAANPTTIFLWIGNNDALIADSTGMPSNMTPIATFTTQYQALISQLNTKTSAHLIIANIPDVTLVAYMQPAATVLAFYSASSGIPVATLSTKFGISPGDYVNDTGIAQINAILAGTQTTPLTDAAFLSAAEAVTVRTTITSYNQVISTAAQGAGATLVDINSLFSTLSSNGLTVNGVAGTTAFLGGIFSLDGVHPTNTGYAVIANKFIDTMNTAFSQSTPDVGLTSVAAADPLWPPNISHKSVPGSSPTVMPYIPQVDNLYLRQSAAR